MSGIFGNNQEDRYLEKQLDDYLDSLYDGSEGQMEELAEELTTQLTTIGAQSPFISNLNDLIVELVAEDCDKESELAAIIIHAMTDPIDSGQRLAALTEKHIKAYIDNNFEDVRDHLYPQEEEVA